MSSRKFKDSMPLAPLKIVALGNQTELGERDYRSKTQSTFRNAET